MRGPDAAGCAILDTQGRVLLVHQTYRDKLWEVPGGIVAPGESAWDAAVRECKEEIGVTPVAPQLSGIYHRAWNDSYVFIFRALAFEGTPRPDGEEIDAARYFRLEEIPWPVTSFALQRLRDAIEFRGQISLRSERREDRRLLGRRSGADAL
jgi:ADP-ribose pyrophosphatase YjhB (NUDIX family)